MTAASAHPKTRALFIAAAVVLPAAVQAQPYEISQPLKDKWRDCMTYAAFRFDDRISDAATIAILVNDQCSDARGAVRQAIIADMQARGETKVMDVQTYLGVLKALDAQLDKQAVVTVLEVRTVHPALSQPSPDKQARRSHRSVR